MIRIKNKALYFALRSKESIIDTKQRKVKITVNRDKIDGIFTSMLFPNVNQFIIKLPFMNLKICYLKR